MKYDESNSVVCVEKEDAARSITGLQTKKEDHDYNIVGSHTKKEDVARSIAEPPTDEVIAYDAPTLRNGLHIRPTFNFNSNIPYLSGAHVLHDGTHVITVNEIGRKLLKMADGKTSIYKMAETLGLDEKAPEIGMFFVELSKAGYLKNRFEIVLYENRTYTKNYAENCTDNNVKNYTKTYEDNNVKNYTKTYADNNMKTYTITYSEGHV